MLLKYNRDAIIKEVQRIINSSEIKRERLARLNETLETKRAANIFINAYFKTDSLLSYPVISKDVLRAAGILDEETLERFHKDRYLIPQSLVETVLDIQRAIIISSYKEKNNYYRELIGLPPIDKEENEYNVIVLSNKECAKIGVPFGTKIHELDGEGVERLKVLGSVDFYKQENPTYKYLNYLGDDALNLPLIRRAKNFELIKFVVNDSMGSFDTLFTMVYSECREYFMEVLYNRHSASIYKAYEEFIGLMIMVMSIHRVFTKQFKMGIERDFFDLDSIEGIFSTYSIPFIGEMTVETKRAVMKNINLLLRYKATDKVLFDILSIFGYENASINELYLTKEHRLDPQGRPIFLYKQVALNPDRPTELTTVLDKENMYNLYFRAVDKREVNPIAALTDDINRREYFDVTDPDPDWIEDARLKEQIMDAEFNYIKTKYIDISVMQRMTKIQFESIMLFKLMLDKKREIAGITVQLPKITGEDNITIFEATLLCLALLSKSIGFAGNIMISPSKVIAVLGYNFAADMNILRSIVKNSPLNKTNILSLIPRGITTDAASLNELYKKILEFSDYITERMASTSDKDEFQALKRIWDILFISENNKDIFKKRDGSIARTYKELLLDVNPRFTEVLNEELDSNNIQSYIDHVISALSKVIPDANSLHSLNKSSGDMVVGIMEMLRRFKSLTTRLKDYALIYILDSRLFNMIYIKDHLQEIIKSRDIDDYILDRYSDVLDNIHKIFVSGDDVVIRDTIDVMNAFTMNESIDIKFKLMSHDAEIHDSIMLLDNLKIKLHRFIKEMKYDDKMNLLELMREGVVIPELLKLNIRDEVPWESKHEIREFLAGYLDVLNAIISKDVINENIRIRERVRIIREMDDGTRTVSIAGDTNKHSIDSYSFIERKDRSFKPSVVKDYTKTGYGIVVDGTVPKPETSNSEKPIDPEFPYGGK